MLLASSFLASSVLSLVLPVVTFIAVVTWLVLVLRRHERRTRGPSAPDAAGRKPQARDAAGLREAE